MQVYSRTHSENYRQDTKQRKVENKPVVDRSSVDKPWYHKRERKLSLDAVAAGVKLFVTSNNKKVSVVSNLDTEFILPISRYF